MFGKIAVYMTKINATNAVHMVPNVRISVSLTVKVVPRNSLTFELIHLLIACDPP